MVFFLKRQADSFSLLHILNINLIQKVMIMNMSNDKLICIEDIQFVFLYKYRVYFEKKYFMNLKDQTFCALAEF
jgi:hypothetical protein